MRVLVAGASGALGVPVVHQLSAAGHDVVALARTPGRLAGLAGNGVTTVVADLLDPAALRVAVQAAAPEVVVHAATALPPGGPVRWGDAAATDRLRDRGTAALLAACAGAGVERVVAQSLVFAHGWGDRTGPDGQAVLDEESPPPGPQVHPAMQRSLDALAALERQVRAAGGVALRLGLFYGRGSGMDAMAPALRRRRLPLPGGGRGLWPVVHVEDAAAAVVAALERGQPGKVYEVADDEAVSFADLVGELARQAGAPPPWSLPAPVARLVAPYATASVLSRLRVSSARAHAELGWRPRFPTYREGLAHDWPPDRPRS